MSTPAPEGSDERRHARMVLAENARQAMRQGASFDGWIERERQSLVDAVSQRDLDAIFHMTWKRRRR